MTNSIDTRLMMQQVDLLVARGHGIEDASNEVGVSQAAYSLWLREHNGAVPVTVERLSHLQSENSRLRRTLAKLSLELKSARTVRRTDEFNLPLAA